MLTETQVVASASRRKKKSELTPLRFFLGVIFIILTVWATAFAFHISDDWMYVPIGISAIVFLALGLTLLLDGV